MKSFSGKLISCILIFSLINLRVPSLQADEPFPFTVGEKVFLRAGVALQCLAQNGFIIDPYFYEGGGEGLSLSYVKRPPPKPEEILS